MADTPPLSSQDDIYERHKIILGQENVDSSPLKMMTNASQKQSKPPTVTPKRFKKFFTPRSSLSTRGHRQSKAGRQLRDITRNAINRQLKTRTDHSAAPSSFDDDFPDLSIAKRRKISLDIPSSPPLSSPIKCAGASQQLPAFEEEPFSPTLSDTASLPDLFDQPKSFPTQVRRLLKSGPSRRILERSFGGYDASSRGRRGPDHATSSSAETSAFMTIPADLHNFHTASLPFCTTACKTTSLVAIGDEEGIVSLIDSAPDSDFSSTYLRLPIHHNAVMDIGFSSDDFLLATASGDQTSRIVDMHTQRTMCVLTGHMGTVKQVRFSPSNDSIIHTSSKDGTVQVWDLRCGGKWSAQTLRTSFARTAELNERAEPEPRYAVAALEAFQGHRLATRPLADASRPELSITAFQYMPNGREHLLLTASEVNASIKLWDLRNAGRRNVVPLSSTPEPYLHRSTRNYGVNALAVSGDGARLYAICRDATVYAYSTSQLALGCVPEMSSQAGRRRMLNEPFTGAAPLYGFRHPNLRLGSFYIKASLRPSCDDRSEILAVGSSESCPVLFPTDERHFLQRQRQPDTIDESMLDDDAELPMFPPLSSQQSAPARATSAQTAPIYQQGTALVSAHRKEVTSVAWTHEGDLISISDDFTARCWREDATKARLLRTGGEVGGQRWQSGWAEVGEGWDEEDL